MRLNVKHRNGRTTIRLQLGGVAITIEFPL
jgi:hypothetical protein